MEYGWRELIPLLSTLDVADDSVQAAIVDSFLLSITKQNQLGETTLNNDFKSHELQDAMHALIFHVALPKDSSAPVPKCLSSLLTRICGHFADELSQLLQRDGSGSLILVENLDIETILTMTSLEEMQNMIKDTPDSCEREAGSSPELNISVYSEQWMKQQRRRLKSIMKVVASTSSELAGLQYLETNFGIDDLDVLPDQRQVPKSSMVPLTTVNPSPNDNDSWLVRIIRFLMVSILDENNFRRQTAATCLRSIFAGLQRHQETIPIPYYLAQDVFSLGLVVLVLDDVVLFPETLPSLRRQSYRADSSTPNVKTEVSAFFRFPVKEEAARLVARAMLVLSNTPQMTLSSNPGFSQILKIFRRDETSPSTRSLFFLGGTLALRSTLLQDECLTMDNITVLIDQVLPLATSYREAPSHHQRVIDIILLDVCDRFIQIITTSGKISPPASLYASLIASLATVVSRMLPFDDASLDHDGAEDSDDEPEESIFLFHRIGLSLWEFGKAFIGNEQIKRDSQQWVQLCTKYWHSSPKLWSANLRWNRACLDQWLSFVSFVAHSRWLDMCQRELTSLETVSITSNLIHFSSSVSLLHSFAERDLKDTNAESTEDNQLTVFTSWSQIGNLFGSQLKAWIPDMTLEEMLWRPLMRFLEGEDAASTASVEDKLTWTGSTPCLASLMPAVLPPDLHSIARQSVGLLLSPLLHEILLVLDENGASVVSHLPGILSRHVRRVVAQRSNPNTAGARTQRPRFVVTASGASSSTSGKSSSTSKMPSKRGVSAHEELLVTVLCASGLFSLRPNALPESIDVYASGWMTHVQAGANPSAPRATDVESFVLSLLEQLQSTSSVHSSHLVAMATSTWSSATLPWYVRWLIQTVAVSETRHVLDESGNGDMSSRGERLIEWWVRCPPRRTSSAWTTLFWATVREVVSLVVGSDEAQSPSDAWWLWLKSHLSRLSIMSGSEIPTVPASWTTLVTQRLPSLLFLTQVLTLPPFLEGLAHRDDRVLMLLSHALQWCDGKSDHHLARAREETMCVKDLASFVVEMVTSVPVSPIVTRALLALARLLLPLLFSISDDHGDGAMEVVDSHVPSTAASRATVAHFLADCCVALSATIAASPHTKGQASVYDTFLSMAIRGLGDTDDKVRQQSLRTFQTLVPLAALGFQSSPAAIGVRVSCSADGNPSPSEGDGEEEVPDLEAISAVPLRELLAKTHTTSFLDSTRPLDRRIVAHLTQECLRSDGVSCRVYQWEAVQWWTSLRRCGLGGVLADDMGLGKTLQALLCLAVLRSEWRMLRPSAMESPPVERYPPILILCPSALTRHWQHEIATHFHPQTVFRACILEPKQFPPDVNIKDAGSWWQRTVWMKHDCVIVAYDTFRRYSEWFRSVSWHACVADEAHVWRNPATQLYRAVSQCISARHRLALTGTPIQNHVQDLWPLVHFLVPHYLGDFQRFRRDYVLPVARGVAAWKRLHALHGDVTGDERVMRSRLQLLTAEGVARLHHLHRLVLPFLLRRTKAQVLTELPSKTIVDLPCILSSTQRRWYASVQQRLRQQLPVVIKDRPPSPEVGQKRKRDVTHSDDDGAGDIGADDLGDAPDDEAIFALYDSITCGDVGDNVTRPPTVAATACAVDEEEDDVFALHFETPPSSAAVGNQPTWHPRQAVSCLQRIVVHPALVIDPVAHPAYYQKLCRDVTCSGKFLRLVQLLIETGIVVPGSSAERHDENDESQIVHQNTPWLRVAEQAWSRVERNGTDDVDEDVVDDAEGDDEDARDRDVGEDKDLLDTADGEMDDGSDSDCDEAAHVLETRSSLPSAKSSAVASRSRKCLIFAQHVGTLSLLEDCVMKPLGYTRYAMGGFSSASTPSSTGSKRSYARLDGSTPSAERFHVARLFAASDNESDSSSQSDSPQILLLTTRACGLGLNLTVADTVIFMEHDWNPATDLQAMDRVHRLGQRHPVMIYRLLTDATIEARLEQLQHFKQDVASRVVLGQAWERNADESQGAPMATAAQDWGRLLWESLTQNEHLGGK